MEEKNYNLKKKKKKFFLKFYSFKIRLIPLLLTIYYLEKNITLKICLK
jgi:hypothetical protein